MSTTFEGLPYLLQDILFSMAILLFTIHGILNDFGFNGDGLFIAIQSIIGLTLFRIDSLYFIFKHLRQISAFLRADFLPLDKSFED